MLEITLKENGKKYCFAADINKNIELIGGTVAGNGSIDWSNEGVSLEKIAEKILGAKSVDILAAAVDDTLYPMDHIITKNHTVSFIFPTAPLGRRLRHYYALFCVLKSMHTLYHVPCTVQNYDEHGFSCTFSADFAFSDSVWSDFKAHLAAEIVSAALVQKRLPYYQAFSLLKQSGSSALVEQFITNEHYDGLRLVISGDFACYHEELAIADKNLYPQLELSYTCENNALIIRGHIR